MNLVAEERFNHLKQDDQIFYRKVLKDYTKLNAWTSYMTWTKRQYFRAKKDDSQELVKMRGRFEEYFIESMKKYIRYFVIEEANKRVFDWITFNEDDKIVEKKKILQPIIETLANYKKHLTGEMDFSDETLSSEVDDILGQDVDEMDLRQAADTRLIMTNRQFGGVHTKRQSHSTVNDLDKELEIEANLRKQFKSPMVARRRRARNRTRKATNESFQSIREAEKRVLYQQSKQYSKYKQDKEYNFGESPPSSTGENSKEKLAQRQFLNLYSGLNRPDSPNLLRNLEVTGHLLGHNTGAFGKINDQILKLKNNLKRIRKVELNDASSIGSIGLRKTIKFSELERMISRFINPNRYHINQFFGLIFFLTIVFVNIFAVYIKKPYMVTTELDITELAPTGDYLSWEIWAQVWTVFYVDCLRIFREGWLPKNYGERFDRGDIFEYFNERVQASAGFAVWPDDRIDKSIRNMSYPYLFDYETWYSYRSKISMLERDFENGKVYWIPVKLPRRAIVKIHQAWATQYLATRN